MREKTKDFVEVWKNHKSPKKVPFTIDGMFKGAKIDYPEQRISNGLRMQVNCERMNDVHRIEIVTLNGVETSKRVIEYLVENEKVRVI